MMQHGIRIGSISTLILAGAVHSFPHLWKWWENLLIEEPSAHLVIGTTALVFGILNAWTYIYEIVNKNKSKKI